MSGMACKIIRADVGFCIYNPARQTLAVPVKSHESLTEQLARNRQSLTCEEGAGEPAGCHLGDSHLRRTTRIVTSAKLDGHISDGGSLGWWRPNCRGRQLRLFRLMLPAGL